MVAQSPPLSVQQPPELTGVQGDPLLINYLRSFALWAKNGLSNKLDTRSAAPGILLQANDAPAGTTPAVFMLQVTTAGAVVATPVPIGGANPG